MPRSRSLSWIQWILPLALCLLLGVGLAPTSEDMSVDDRQTTSTDATDARVSVPVLAGRSGLPDDLAADADADEIAPSPPSSKADDAPAPAEEENEDHMRDGAPLTANHPLVAPVIAIQERHTRTLLEHPLVVGTATGMNENGEIAVVVLAKAVISDLPRSLDGAPVMIYVTGELFSSKGKPPGKGGGKDAPSVDPTARFARPVPIGVSTGHPAITAGTIGCRVSVTNAGVTTVYALSNNHVYADENDASIGDAVIQPGSYDGGSSSADDIGTLSAAVALDFRSVQAGGTNTMDAAIAACTTSTLGAGTPADGYGLPKTATTSPAINLRVQKYGRTTGKTNGRISAINATLNIGYSTGTAGFVGQIVITPGSFSAGGDSGSLIVVQKGGSARKPVALLFAGSSTSTIASPIGPILSTFGVTIDGE